MQVQQWDKKEEARRRSLYKYVVARSDITAALRITQLLLKEVDQLGHPLFFPLQEAIIINYARPFTENDGFGALSQKFAEFDDAVLSDLHQQLLDARDQRVAHSDLSIRRVVVQPRGQRTPIEPRTRRASIGVQIANQFFPLDAFAQIEIMCLAIGGNLESTINKELGILFPDSDTPGNSVDLLPYSDQVLITPPPS